MPYLLPADPATEETVCIRVYVPNKPEYIRAFWGQYYDLTRWWTWERDAAHRAKEAAAQFLARFFLADEEYRQGVGCGDMGITGLRQSEDGCTLEYTTDGENWSSFADLSLCAVPGPVGPAGPQGERGAAGPAGTNGKTPEFKAADGCIFWRYQGAREWKVLTCSIQSSGGGCCDDADEDEEGCGCE